MDDEKKTSSKCNAIAAGAKTNSLKGWEVLWTHILVIAAFHYETQTASMTIVNILNDSTDDCCSCCSCSPIPCPDKFPAWTTARHTVISQDDCPCGGQQS